MNARRTDWQDLLFGLFLIAVAGIALAATHTLSGGTAADMGPGYMPRAIAIMLLAFGLWFSIRGIRRPFVGIAPVRLQPLLAITASVAVFALTATRFGRARRGRWRKRRPHQWRVGNPSLREQQAVDRPRCHR